MDQLVRRAAQAIVDSAQSRMCALLARLDIFSAVRPALGQAISHRVLLV